jgi:hypothetical protein
MKSSCRKKVTGDWRCTTGGINEEFVLLAKGAGDGCALAVIATRLAARQKINWNSRVMQGAASLQSGEEFTIGVR